HVACTQLSVHCAEELPSGQRSDHFADVHAAGLQKNLCCAGSLVIDMSTAKLIQPVRAAHETFIVNFVPKPICRTPD
ncbi:MAG: hypothetical protein ACKO1K_00115, partial [Burkholderiales bacterium]